jgi:Tfp pilus assembly protein PilV
VDAVVLVAVALLAVGVLAFVVLATLAHRNARHGLAGLTRQEVVVQTKDDRAIRGMLKAHYSQAVVLAQPRYLDEVQPVDLEGEVVVDRANISWLQVLRPEA